RSSSARANWLGTGRDHRLERLDHLAPQVRVRLPDRRDRLILPRVAASGGMGGRVICIGGAQHCGGERGRIGHAAARTPFGDLPNAGDHLADVAQGANTAQLGAADPLDLVETSRELDDLTLLWSAA